MKSLRYSLLKKSNSLKDFVYYKKDFLSVPFCDKILAESNRRTKGAATVGAHTISRKIRDADGVNFSINDPLLVELKQKFQDALSEYIDDDKYVQVDNLKQTISVVSYTNQIGYMPHVDATYPCNADLDTRLYSIVAYFNDDYVGGDIYFPDIGLTFKPKKGSCLIFPSNNLFRHGVYPVKGYKLISPCWFYTKTSTIDNSMPFGF